MIDLIDNKYLVSTNGKGWQPGHPSHRKLVACNYCIRITLYNCAVLGWQSRHPPRLILWSFAVYGLYVYT